MVVKADGQTVYRKLEQEASNLHLTSSTWSHALEVVVFQHSGDHLNMYTFPSSVWSSEPSTRHGPCGPTLTS